MSVSINKFMTVFLLIQSSIFGTNFAYAYSEIQLKASEVILPRQDESTSQFLLLGGASFGAEMMNSDGLSLGIGTTWSRSYRWVDLTEHYWFNQHMNGLYVGLSQHLQYFKNTGFGAGVNIGYSLPLTYYFNLNLEAEAGYSASKFFKVTEDPFYGAVSVGIAWNIR